MTPTPTCDNCQYKQVCEYHEDTQKALTSVSTSLSVLTKVWGAAVVLLFPMVVGFFVYFARMDTRITTIEAKIDTKAERVDVKEVNEDLQRVKAQRNADHPTKDPIR